MSGTLHDASKELVMEKISNWLEKNTTNHQAFIFALEQMSLAYDFVVESYKNDGKLSKGDLIKFFAKKGNSFSTLSDDSMIECISSIIDLIIAASELEKNGIPLAGEIWYFGSIALEGINVGGSCYIWYLDTKIQKKLDDIEEDIKMKKIRKYSSMQSRHPSAEEINATFMEMLAWRMRQPNRPTSTTWGASHGASPSSPQGEHPPPQGSLSMKLH